MARIRAKDTKPELLVRRMVHRMGFRFRLHRANLPGKPDLVFASRRRVIFVHGCFWHLHSPCRHYRYPQSGLDFWGPKLEANRRRDRVTRVALRRLGWRVLVVWECQTRDKKAVERRLRSFLERP